MQALAILRRETGAFFHSPMAPMVLAGFLVAVGLFFTIFLLGYSEMSLTALQSPRSGNYLNLAEGLFRPLVSNTVFFLLFLLPAITMRLFAPEFQSGRYDLIASWPVTDGTWVVGKWLAAFAAGAVMILCSLAYFVVVWFLGDPEPGPAAAAIAGELLFVACLTSWGTLASTLFSHQMVAYFLAFLMSLFFFLVGTLERFLPSPVSTIADELSLLTHFERFSVGVLDSRDILYFALMTAVPLLAATAAMAGRRLPARRTWRVWTPTLLGAVLAVVLFLLGQQFVWTADLTGNKRYSLAPQTLQILDGLEGTLADASRQAGADSASGREVSHLTAYAFYQRLDPARDVTEALLKACAQRTRRFQYRALDPETELDLVRTYGVTVSRTIVLEAGDRHTTLLQPEESGLASAIYRLAAGKRTLVCHLFGHGEHLLDNDERPGYATFAQVLAAQGYDLRPLALAEARRVPAECGVLVIAGPRFQPEPAELTAIEDHLRRGGAVLALFDPPTPVGWVEWMTRWRIGLTGSVIVAADRAERFGMGARTVVVTDGYGDHEISRPMQGVATVFPLVQPLAQVGEPDSLIAGAVLLQSSELTWAETDPATLFSGTPIFDRARDVQGPLPFGMVLELRLDPAGGRPGRMVVLGNSEFANNANFNLAGNRDLLLNALGWLSREDDLVALRGKDPLSQPLVLSPTAKTVLGWGSALGWPVLVGSLALGVMLRHSRGARRAP